MNKLKELDSIRLGYKGAGHIHLPKYVIEDLVIDKINIRASYYMGVFDKVYGCDNFSVVLRGNKLKQDIKHRLLNGDLFDEKLIWVELFYKDDTNETYWLSGDTAQSVEETINYEKFKDIKIESIRFR